MGSFPFTSYKQVFVEDAYSPCQTGATISVLSSSLLLDKDIIEQTYETRRVLTKALTSQYIDHYLGKKCWWGSFITCLFELGQTHKKMNRADYWLTIGLNNYITSLFLQKNLGNNEYRFRLKMVGGFLSLVLLFKHHH
jgi:transcription initiation factor TFIID subunit 2